MSQSQPSLTQQIISQMRWMLPPLCVIQLLLAIGAIVVLFTQIETRFPAFNDEAIFADIIFRSRAGMGMNTPLFETFMPQVEHYSFWYPPVFFIMMSGWFSLIGEGINQGRAGTIILSLIALLLVYQLLKPVFRSKWSVTILVGLLITDPYFQMSATVFRMEMLTVVWGIASLLVYQFSAQQTRSERTRSLLVFASGAFGGLSLLTHPLGGIFGLTIGLAILTEQASWLDRVKHLALYGLMPLLLIGGWILSFYQHLDVFLLQNLIQLHRKVFNTYYLIEIFKYQPIQRTLISLYMLATTGAIAILSTRWKQNLRLSRLYLPLLPLGIIVPFLMKEMWYLLVYPFIGLISILLITEWGIARKHWWVLALAPAVLVLHLLIFLDHQATPRMFDSYNSFSQAVSEQIPDGSSVLLSSFPDPFFYLRDNRPDLDLREAPNTPPTEPIDLDIYDQIFSRSDILVVNRHLTGHQYQYMLQNTEKVLFQSTPEDVNQFMIVKFTPREERVPLEVPPHLQWTYPTLND